MSGSMVLMARRCGRNVGQVRHYSQKSTPRRVAKGVVSPLNKIPHHIVVPPYAKAHFPHNPVAKDSEQIDNLVEIKNDAQIEGMRKAGILARKTREYAGSLVRPGVTTDAIDRLVHEFIVAHNAYPSPLTYTSDGGGSIPFPKSICTSVNDVAAHGIPDSRPLQEGDVVAIDVTVFLDGFHGDTCATFPVGQISEKAARLIDTAKESMEQAISICRPGVEFHKIGCSIEEYVTAHRFSVNSDLVGHGIGSYFHGPPAIIHSHNNIPSTHLGAPHMLPGMTFTIEPIICGSRSSSMTMWDDGWTFATRDGSWSAQFEHTILITKDGVEMLTNDPITVQRQ